MWCVEDDLGEWGKGIGWAGRHSRLVERDWAIPDVNCRITSNSEVVFPFSEQVLLV